MQWSVAGYPRLKSGLGWAGIMLGSLSIYSMSKIYLLPTHSSWDSPATVISFLLTSLILGATSVAVMMIINLRVSEDVADIAETSARKQLIRQSFIWLAGVAFGVALINLLLNLLLISRLIQGDLSAQTSLVLLLYLYRPLFGLRYVALFTGVGWFGLTAVVLYRRGKTQYEIMRPVYLACLLVLIAEILGRFLFYATHVRMGI